MSGSMAWLRQLAPDVTATVQRFPFAIVLAAVVTVLAIALLNEWLDWSEEAWARAGFGVAAAAVLATAGALFAESRPTNRLVAAVLTYLLPLAAVALFQITDTRWFVPYLLPFVAVLWLSAASFTHIGRGEAREQAQNRFWWFNQRAVVAACMAAAGFFVVVLGTLAIERSLAALFGVHLDTLFYYYVLPVAGLFLTPLYWLSTLPRPTEFAAEELQRPDFAAQAVSFLGQFLLTPLLVIYALILLAYALMIVITGEFPQGILGWMVLGFTVTGAANWLLLHPPFMRSRPLVQFFRRWWFWLTVVPLGLYIVAVYIRIDAYGFTSERVLLVLGGVWALGLTLAWLLRIGADIRLIPALAGVLFVLASVGPWNLEHGPLLDQARRLDAVLEQEGFTADSEAWTDVDRARAARSAIGYLTRSDEGVRLIERTLERRGIDVDVSLGAYRVYERLVLQDVDLGLPRPTLWLTHDAALTPVPVAETPYFLGAMHLPSSPRAELPGLLLYLSDRQIGIAVEGVTVTYIDLSGWIDAQTGPEMRDPVIAFSFDGIEYRLVFSEVSLVPSGPQSEQLRFGYASGTLFASAIPAYGSADE